MSVGLITQARCSSSRLPRKVMLEVAGRILLEVHLSRLVNINWKLIVATTDEPIDDCIVELCNNLGVSVYRGSRDDVLGRYYHCATLYNLSTIIRCTSDCPLIDASLIASGLEAYSRLENIACNYLSNVVVRRDPKGADFEIFSYKALKEAHLKATELEDREHVTPYIRRTLTKVSFDRGKEDLSWIRLTLDYPEDYLFIKELIEQYQVDSLGIDAISSLIKHNSSLSLKSRELSERFNISSPGTCIKKT